MVSIWNTIKTNKASEMCSLCKQKINNDQSNYIFNIVRFSSTCAPLVSRRLPRGIKLVTNYLQKNTLVIVKIAS